MRDNVLRESKFYNHSGDIRDILRVAFPLIMAASSHALKLFTDRWMLSFFSQESLNASLSAGITSFALISFFMGTSGYANTFVAQYTGAGKGERVGESVWQAIYIALLGGLVLAVASMFAVPLFQLFGHPPLVQIQQSRYFSILSSLAVFPLLTNAVMCFWSGQGRTWTIFAISFSTVIVNVVFNAVLIFGAFGLPPMGITGAAIATNISSIFGLVLTLSLFWNKRNREQYNTFPHRTFSFVLFRRLLRFGVPNGINMFLDIGAFNMFVILLGRTGAVEGAATAIAFTMNAMAFIPMIGIGMTINILVGQSIGTQDLPHARQSVRSARNLTLLYMGTLATLFLIFPSMIVGIFNTSPETAALAETFLQYIAAYLLFDGMFIVYSSAIKGAGDTNFAMIVGVSMAWTLMVLPCWLMQRAGFSVWYLWTNFVVYIMLTGVVFYWRYRAGHWERMRVIEQ